MERLTEHAPFLSTGASETVQFDPPGPRTQRAERGGGRRLRLGAGLVSLASLRVGAGPGEAGSALVEGEDFWLLPADATRRDRPFTSVEFARVQWGLPRSVLVAGVWGFGLQIPDDAWKAVLDLAAGTALQSLREGLGIGPVEVKDDEVSLRYSIERLAAVGDGLVSRAACVALAYRLIS